VGCRCAPERLPAALPLRKVAPITAAVQRVFVGDVQGCAEELDEIVGRASAAFGSEFELWLVGDLINRGPDNVRVLRRVRELMDRERCHAVLGNHEVGFLACAFGLRAPGPMDTLNDLLERSDLDEWVGWIRRLPLALTGRLGERPFAMVHASLDPAWTLEDLERLAALAGAPLADPDPEVARQFLAAPVDENPFREPAARMLTCRSVLPDGRWSSLPPAEVAGARPWHEAWREARHGYGVVYGHWAMQGLQVAPGLRGLDTGCVHHGRGRPGLLTAWLPDEALADPFAVPDARFWHVPARRPYARDARS
jgi:bis(5'-nucleosyl)-tetraphosphatase (symmetrical)